MTEKRPILIIDDDPITQVVVAEQLEAGGYGVEVASDGTEGLEKAKRGRYRFILMDCPMPGTAGFTCAEEIRRCEVSQGAKRDHMVRILEAHPSPDDASRERADAEDLTPGGRRDALVSELEARLLLVKA